MTHYAGIIPLTALPLPSKSYTYSSAEPLARGTLVQIPWRAKIIFGIVDAPDQPKPSFAAKDVVSILPVRLPAHWIDILWHFSRDVSVASLAARAMPSWTKKEQAALAEGSERWDWHDGERSGVVPTERSATFEKMIFEMKADIAARPDRWHVVMAGSRDAATRIAGTLEDSSILAFRQAQGDERGARVWDDDVSPKEYREFWHALRLERGGVLIAGRKAWWLPWPQGTVMHVVEPDAPWQSEDNMRPYYGARDMMAAWAEAGAEIKSYVHSGASLAGRVTLHDCGRTHFSLERVADGIRAAAGRGLSSLVYFNRRGDARSLECPSCGFAAGCPTADCYRPLLQLSGRWGCTAHGAAAPSQIPASCPECGHAPLEGRGYGIERLARELEAALPKGFPIVTAGESPLPPMGGPVAYLSTRRPLYGLPWASIGHISVPLADYDLAVPRARREEEFKAYVGYLLGMNEAADCLLQTKRPDAVAKLLFS